MKVMRYAAGHLSITLADRYNAPPLSKARLRRGNNMSDYKDYMCVVCGFVYSEAAGLPEEGFPPGTRWDDIPANWVCPECGAAREDFEMVEI